jgi:4-amino-4-deoxy-L-arabinose transferase-like glycosyltransferase
LDEEVERGGSAARGGAAEGTGSSFRYQLAVIVVATLIFFGCLISPPNLMDDVDAVQAQIARNMLDSGDWVTARLDGVKYLEKSPLKYWMIATSYMVFGVHDWAARIPVALATVLLCWVTTRFGMWAFGRRTGMYAGLVLATGVGLFLFTRILIPDVILTLAITLALWGMMRALDPDEPHPGRWAIAMWAAMGTGLLLKGLIAAVFPVAAGLLYIAVSGQFLRRETWKRLKIFSGALVFLAIAAPWHVIATLRNPPYLDFTLHSESGSYRGFFWFYFLNEHVLRFLNRRWPRDYNTVPRLWFWLFHLLWMFPWTAYLPRTLNLGYRGSDRASRTRRLALCWAGFILVFFTFSTTQEYYSMPAYPALALLLACAIAKGEGFARVPVTVVAGLAAAAIAAILVLVWNTPAPGDISAALSQNPDLYTLSLGHMADLTLQAFAYLRVPLAIAGIAFLVGAVGVWRRPVAALVVMMVLFFHAARLAMVTFDPYLSSRPLAEALRTAPEGKWICDDQYYTFSSIFFYSNRRALLLNGRKQNLEYGSYAPDAPKGVFITDAELPALWSGPDRYYLSAEGPQTARLKKLVGEGALHVVKESGGKFLFTNR